MTSVQILELLIRGAAVGGFLGLAIAVARGGMVPARATGILFCLGAAAHTLTQMPGIESALGWVWPLVWVFSVAGAGLLWAFATELFQDHRHFEIYRFAPAAALVAFSISAALSPPNIAPLFWLAHNVLGAGLMAHVLFVVAAGWRGDLVESRRRLRGPLIAAGATYGLAITAVESGEILWRSAQSLSPVAAVLLLAMSSAAMAAFLRADPELFGSAPEASGATASTQTPVLSREETASATALDRLMSEERLYREPGLTISRLALKLRLPEHRLRRLINQRLGHRNFNAFLNQWRLADVKQALADPGQKTVPISTIALDAGYESLGPFNRAFKAETNLTPSEFRAHSLAMTSEPPGGMLTSATLSKTNFSKLANLI